MQQIVIQRQIKMEMVPCQQMVDDKLSNLEDEPQRTTSQDASTSVPGGTEMDVDSDDEYDTPETRAAAAAFATMDMEASDDEYDTADARAEAAAFSGMDSNVLDQLYFTNTQGIKPGYIQP